MYSISLAFTRLSYTTRLLSHKILIFKQMQSSTIPKNIWSRKMRNGDFPNHFDRFENVTGWAKGKKRKIKAERRVPLKKCINIYSRLRLTSPGLSLVYRILYQDWSRIIEENNKLIFFRLKKNYMYIMWTLICIEARFHI